MIREGEAKVTRYNRTGREIQNIQKDNKGETLYVHPHYITGNINGDICTSDIGKQAVVVVDELGNYRFSYEGHERNFSPYMESALIQLVAFRCVITKKPFTVWIRTVISCNIFSQRKI